MKKIGTGILGIIILIMFIVSCGGTPKASSPDELDMAIRDASDYLNDNIPAGSKIVILNIQSDSTALSDYIIDELIANAVNDRIFSVVDRQQLDLIRQEQDFQWAGEVSDQTALEIGNFLGAQIIVSGRVSQVADRYRFTIRALEVQTARVVGQNNMNIAAGATIAALMRSGGGSGITTTASGGRTQTTSSGTTSQQTAPTVTAPTQPAAIANGTYTFWPRPRAKLNGIPANDYLIKIVVEGRFMVFYMTNVERGISGNPSGGWGGSSHVRNMVTNLDRSSQTWNAVSYRYNSDNNGQGMILSFEGITATRFSLECPYDNTIFDEINLADAEYEP